MGPDHLASSLPSLFPLNAFALTARNIFRTLDVHIIVQYFPKANQFLILLRFLSPQGVHLDRDQEWLYLYYPFA